MKVPYCYMPYEAGTDISETYGELPCWCRFLKISTVKSRRFSSDNWQAVAQQFILKPFTFEVLELNASQDVRFKIEIRKKITLLYFLLEGNVVKISTESGRVLSEIHGNFFYLTQNQPGTYSSHFKKGFNIAIIICIAPKWLNKISEAFPNLNTEVKAFLSGKTSSTAMPLLKIDKALKQRIELLYAMNDDKIVAGEDFFSYCLAQTIKQYDHSINTKKEITAYKIREYLDTHFTNPEINLVFLTNHFHICERTLRYQFHKLFHTTVKQYCNGLRLEYAKKLFQETGKKVKDIYADAGFKDEYTFRKAFSLYLRLLKFFF